VTTKRVVELFRPYRGRVALVAAIIVVTSLLGIVNPYLTRAVFDRALFVPGGPNLRLLSVLVTAMIVVTLIGAGVGVWQTYLTNVLGNRVMQDLRDRLFAHLQQMQLAFFAGTRTGEIQSRLGNDVSGVQSVVTDTASSVLSTTVTVVSSLIAMFALSWQLTLLSLALLPIFVLLQVRVGQVRRRIAAQTQTSLADLTSITEESLSVSGVLLAKVFDRQRRETQRYRRESARQAGLQVRQTMTGQSFFAVVQAFFTITPALIYLVAGFQLAGGVGITAGTIVAFTTLQNRLLFPIIQLLRVALDVQTSLALFTRIFEYLDLEPQIVDRPDALELPKESVRGDVRYDHVGFRYPGSERWTLTDVDLAIEAGQLAAIVGPSGSGKTTMSYLIPRLYDVEQGRVTVDGHDVRDVALSSLAELVGVVTQESYLFHDTIRANPGQPGVRARGRHRGRAVRGGARREHPRPDHELRRRLRHRGRRARLPAVGRGEAAAGDRQGDPQGPAGPDPGRGHVVAGHHQRAPGAERAGAADARADHHRDRPPPVDHPGRRRDLRARRRPPGGAWDPRGAAGARRAVRAALPRAVRRRRDRGPLRRRRGPAIGPRRAGGIMSAWCAPRRRVEIRS
jgi:ATP-binding cassette subfamily B protein